MKTDYEGKILTLARVSTTGVGAAPFPRTPTASPPVSALLTPQKASPVGLLETTVTLGLESPGSRLRRQSHAAVEMSPVSNAESDVLMHVSTSATFVLPMDL